MSKKPRFKPGLQNAIPCRASTRHCGFDGIEAFVHVHERHRECSGMVTCAGGWESPGLERASNSGGALCSKAQPSNRTVLRRYGARARVSSRRGSIATAHHVSFGALHPIAWCAQHIDAETCRGGWTIP